MSFTTKEYSAVCAVLPPHLVAFIEGSAYFKDQSVKAVEPLFGPNGISGSVDAYHGSSAFIVSCKGKMLTDAQKRGVLNIFRTIIQTGDLPTSVGTALPASSPVGHASAGAGSSSTSSPTSGGSSRRKTWGSTSHPRPHFTGTAPASGFVRLDDGTQLKVSTENREGKEYPCSNSSCSAILPGITAMYLHHINEHDGGWAWKNLKKIHPDLPGSISPFEKDLNGKWVTKGSYLAPPAVSFAPPSGPVVTTLPAPITYAPAPVAPVTSPPPPPMFTPKLGLDVSGLFDGRFAVEVGDETVYVLKRTVKKPYTRTGRYVWGKTTRQWERIQPGTLELRQQRGSTKELIGEQQKDSSVYYGEQEEVIQTILADPEAAMELYGKKMKRCAYCGRPLTDPESQARGIGPDCWEEKHYPKLVARRNAVLKAAGMVATP